MSKVFTCSVLVILLCLSIPLPASAERVKLLPSKSMGYLPLFVAQSRGFFKDEGIRGRR